MVTPYGIPSKLPNGKHNPAYQTAYRNANKERLTRYQEDYINSHVEERHYYLLRIKAMAIEIVQGEVECAYCDCDDIELLQFNYVSGGHTKLVKQGKLTTGTPLAMKLVDGKVNPKLFNVLCIPHNSIDHLGRRRNDFKILWKRKRS